MTAVEQKQGAPTQGGPFYTLFVDGQEHHLTEDSISGAVIMELAGIPLEVGLLIIEEDGTQRRVDPIEVFELKPGRRFKKAPRFRRGAK